MTTITLPNFCESVWNLFQHFSSAVSLLQFPQLGTQLDSVLALHWTIANNVSNVIFSIFLVDINYRQVMKLSHSSAWKWFWVVVQNTSWNSVKRMPENIIFYFLVNKIYRFPNLSIFKIQFINSLIDVDCERGVDCDHRCWFLHANNCFSCWKQSRFLIPSSIFWH